MIVKKTASEYQQIGSMQAQGPGPKLAGVPPTAWGPSLWRAIHLVALGCPRELDAAAAAEYRAFFTHLPGVLPCASCAANYRRHLLELPIEPYLASGEKLFEWTVRLHNVVNAELRRPGSRADWTPAQAQEAIMRAVMPEEIPAGGWGTFTTPTMVAAGLAAALLLLVLALLLRRPMPRIVKTR